MCSRADGSKGSGRTSAHDAQLEQLGSSPWPEVFASGRPKVEHSPHFPPHHTHRCGTFSRWVDLEPHGKFMQMWGEEGWRLRRRRSTLVVADTQPTTARVPAFERWLEPAQARRAGMLEEPGRRQVLRRRARGQEVWCASALPALVPLLHSPNDNPQSLSSLTAGGLSHHACDLAAEHLQKARGAAAQTSTGWKAPSAAPRTARPSARPRLRLVQVPSALSEDGAPHQILPPWTIWRLRPLLRTPERRLSLSARRGLDTVMPQAAPNKGEDGPPSTTRRPRCSGSTRRSGTFARRRTGGTRAA